MPVKGLTIPRLELMALIIGVRSLEFVKSELRIPIEKTVVWSDSQCVLSWLKSTKQLSVFVRNRVDEIKSHKGIEFKYIKSVENPADVATRGCDVKKLCANDLWWHGPEWLREPETEWPEDTIELDKKAEINYKAEFSKPEMKKRETIMLENEQRPLGINVLSIIECGRFSSVSTLVRVVGLVLKFLRKLKKCDNAKGCILRSK